MLLLAIMAGTVSAQRGKRAIKRIDREVQETVFILRGHGWSEVPFHIPNTMRVT